jgi:hypothetical protein
MSRSGGRAYPGWHARSNTGSACGSRSTRPFPPSPPPRPSVNGLVSRRRSLSRLLLHTRRVPKRERAGCRARVGILEIRACALASLALRAGAEVERAGLLAQGENVTVTAPIKFHFLPVIGAQRPEGKTSGEQGAEASAFPSRQVRALANKLKTITLSLISLSAILSLRARDCD